MTESLLCGAPLNAATFAEFITRLKHDCVGAGVHEHCTSDVVFIVMAKEFIYGIDMNYVDDLAIYCGETYYHSIPEFLKTGDQEFLDSLDQKSRLENDLPFAELEVRDQFLLIGSLENFSVYGYGERWRLINFHFTQTAADEFIRNHGHKHEGELQVFQESQGRCYEFNAIKNALIEGKLVWKD